MNDKLLAQATQTATAPDSKQDPTPTGDCCTVPGGGDPGPGGPTGIF
jgi:hypothetical protein